ncbi:hypothetical protein ACFFIS_16725 [Virgibacillus soli]|uniref:SHOCT domain-containing protein n=1 Tax=Paracerasibacillus soli TaxID=480284 RepID=A0ABU5CVG9_9BACI|nr:hypothetical protein [Virgibacillus soli]MDY0410372.1 hypothetical protein [Virgibacillus soli]
MLHNDSGFFGIVWLLMIGISVLAVFIIIRRDKKRKQLKAIEIKDRYDKGEINQEEYKRLIAKIYY